MGVSKDTPFFCGFLESSTKEGLYAFSLKIAVPQCLSNSFSNTRFSKHFDISGLSVTQPELIRHPWLSSSFRWRRVSELLGCEQSAKKNYVFSQIVRKTLRDSNFLSKCMMPLFRRGFYKTTKREWAFDIILAYVKGVSFVRDKGYNDRSNWELSIYRKIYLK